MGKIGSLIKVIAKGYFILVVVLIVAFLVLGTGTPDNSSEIPQEEEEIKASELVNGREESFEVRCFKLTVIGEDLEVRVLNNNVQNIKVVGYDNIIYYPKGSTPVIEEEGYNNTFIPY